MTTTLPKTGSKISLYFSIFKFDIKINLEGYRRENPIISEAEFGTEVIERDSQYVKLNPENLMPFMTNDCLLRLNLPKIKKGFCFQHIWFVVILFNYDM